MTPVQEKMLLGDFYINGWHNIDYLGEADELVAKGLLTKRVTVSDQETTYHYSPVRENLDGLRHSSLR